MSNPVLVEVLRGQIVESVHRGSVSVVDADGAIVIEIGDVARPVFPRSAVKAIQALPLVESGAADAFGFGNKEIALACASHSGEPAHVELARSMLTKAGLEETDLECGAHWPARQEVALPLAATGAKPTALHNNCSGKHAGFLCVCRHLGITHRGYARRGHALQEMVREAMEDVTGEAHDADHCGTDGCSIPTYAVPISSLALGFARLSTGMGLAPERAKAASRIFAACMAEPFYVAGTGRADTGMMGLIPGGVFVKTGAEGVYCGAVPELGLGIALKCDDGASRASEAMISAVLAKLLSKDEQSSAKLATMARPTLTSWNGIAVGAIRPTAALA